MYCLHHALEQIPLFFDRYAETGRYTWPTGYFTPGYVAVAAAALSDRGLPRQDLVCLDGGVESYLSAVGFHQAVWRVDEYPLGRVNQGVNYSLVTALRGQYDVDTSTASINGCLRQMARQGRDYTQSPAFGELTHVVGELHDNVWSHGKNTGFSLAQRRKDYSVDDYVLEFALADCGMGFLAELQRARKGEFTTHRAAIEWCIEEGNSSKLASAVDDWAQSLPEDYVGSSPFGGAVETVEASPNNHQGLGLAKLVSLAKLHQGDLYLASGNCLMRLDPSGTMSFRTLSYEWRGVAISLSLRESKLEEATPVPDSLEIEQLMNILRG